ncbi:hypothetical protein BJX76DRAFT_216586 [Aspergillus varians]
MHVSQRGKSVIGASLSLWDVTYTTNIAYASCRKLDIFEDSRGGSILHSKKNEAIPFRDFCFATWAHFGHTPLFELHIPEGLACFAGLVCETLTWAFGRTTTLSRGGVREMHALFDKQLEKG